MVDTASDKKAARAAALRTQALEIGAEIIRDSGIEKLQARVIALRLGVSVGTIYNLFGNMEEYVMQLNSRTYDAMFAWCSARLEEATDRDVRGQMLVLCRAYMDYVSTHQAEWDAIMISNKTIITSQPDWYRQKERDLFALVVRTIRKLPGLSDDTQDVRIAHALWASIHGIVTVAMGRRKPISEAPEVWQEIELVIDAMAHRYGA